MAWNKRQFFVLMFFGMVWMMYHNCSRPSGDEIDSVAVGQTVLLKSIAESQSQKTPSDYSHVMIFFSVSGNELNLNDNLKIQMFNTIDDQPVYEFTTEELRDMHNKTACPGGLSEMLDNEFEGDVLFCHRTVDLSKVSHFRVTRLEGLLEEQSGATKTATSFLARFAKDQNDLIAISVNME